MGIPALFKVLSEVSKAESAANGDVSSVASKGISKKFNPDKRIDTKHQENLNLGDKKYNPDKRVDVGNKTTESSKVEETPGLKDEPHAKQYYDDNGKLYREGDNLLPNEQYELKGYKYTTDDKGRVINAEGSLQLKDHPGRNKIRAKMDTIGKGDQLPGDQRGHLIGDQFNGSGDITNLTPMSAKLNQVDLYRYENFCADAVKAGSDVYWKIEPQYKGPDYRAYKFKLSYSIDGEIDYCVFKN